MNISGAPLQKNTDVPRLRMESWIFWNWLESKSFNENQDIIQEAHDNCICEDVLTQPDLKMLRHPSSYI